ncbi:MAG TPA: DUF2796 domain-containing protein [Hyphomicrobiaceae bacterium]|nr:DUF2796 domain-containing protein [Hyphomicrobiaceae bacterium]
MVAGVRCLVMLCGLAGMLAIPSEAHDKRREMGAHEHGRGTLNIALEGTRVSLELEVPAADIVGFERAARTRKEKAAVEKATAQLSAPLSLFAFPAAAACRVAEAKVEFGAGEPSHAGAGKADAHGEGHSEVQARYVLDCTGPANITGIEFGYFRTFAGAQKLDVNVVTGKGQNKFQVTRARPSLSLAGMM